MARFFIVLIAFLFFHPLPAQQISCAVCYEKTEFDAVESTQKLEKKYKRILFKRRECHYRALLSFTIANRYFQSGDTACRQWYRTAIEDSKTSYTYNKNGEEKIRSLYLIAVSYFYLGDLKSAQSYFYKLIKCKNFIVCGFYYHAILELNSGNYESALEGFEEYVSAGGNISVTEKITECKKHLQ